MFPHVAESFLLMIGFGAAGLEFPSLGEIGLLASAVAAIVFVGSLDAWACEGSSTESTSADA